MTCAVGLSEHVSYILSFPFIPRNVLIDQIKHDQLTIL